jgi:uncharacterized protein with GYD domain
MPYYLVQSSDSREGWTGLMKDDLEKRVQYIAGIVEKMGGKLEGCWASFGEYDWVFLFQMPDNETAASLAITVIAGGAVKACKTTPLLTVKEAAAALKKAAASGYQPPK